MISFTKTESLIIEVLKRAPQSAFDLEQSIDENKEFSKDYISVMINSINKKAGRKIIIGKNIAGEYRYLLVESSIEYKILNHVENTNEELAVIKSISNQNRVMTVFTIILIMFFVILSARSHEKVEYTTAEASNECVVPKFCK